MNTAPRGAVNASRHHVTEVVTAACLLAALSACGGRAPGAQSGNAPPALTKIELGSTVSGTFTNQVLAVSPASIGTLSSATVTANIVDATTGKPYTQLATVTFSSVCALATPTHTATLTPASVTTSTGTAATTYQDNGCHSKDTITAQTTINGTTLSATGSLNVARATVRGLQFISATPVAGDIAASTVTFQVADANGDPVPNTRVDFAVNTDAGGIGLNPLTSTTDSRGQVTTRISAGSVHTAVTITATRHGTSQSVAVPDVLTSTDVPARTGLSLTIATHNIEGYDIDGSQDSVTARLTDRYGNPAGEGARVYFTANGGSLAGSCATAGGECSVNWNSQAPRPQSDALDVIGLTHVLAYTRSEEPYADSCSGLGTGSPETGTAGGPLGCTDTGKMLGLADCIVMSSSFAALPAPAGAAGDPPVVTVSHDGGNQSIAFQVSDRFGNVLSNGTTIAILQSGVQGYAVSLAESTDGGTRATVGDVGCKESAASWPKTYHIILVPNRAATAFTGTLTVLVTSNPSATPSQSGWSVQLN